MKSKTIIRTATALAVACSAWFSVVVAGTNQTYSVNVGNGLWKHTNVVQVSRCTSACTLIRYMDGNTTNDFHAWAVTVKVETNPPARR